MSSRLTPAFILRCVLILAFSSIPPTTLVHAEAFRVLDQSASATGQGTAFAAQADDPSALYFNPGGMTQLRGIQVSGGGLLLGGSISYTSFSGETASGELGGPIAIPPPTNLYITANLKDVGFTSLDHITVGLGVNSPFGNLTEYPEGGPFSEVLTDSALPLIDVKPTVAFRVNEYLSVGVGLDIYTFSGLFGEGQAELQQIAGPEFGTGALSLLANPGDKLELNGTDTALGFNVGLLLTPWRTDLGKPRLNLAVVYRSGVKLKLEGELLNKTQGKAFQASTAAHLPQIITLGLAYWPVRNNQHEWKVEFDYDYADWSSFNDLDIRVSTPTLTFTIPKPRNYNATNVYMLGTEYKWLNPAWWRHWEVALRGGYVYAESPIPSVTFTPDIPDSEYHAFSIGVGLLCTEQGWFLGVFQCGGDGAKVLGKKGAIGLDLAYQAILYQERGINNNQDSRVNGIWDTILHVGAMNLRVIFDPSKWKWLHGKSQAPTMLRGE